MWTFVARYSSRFPLLAGLALAALVCGVLRGAAPGIARGDTLDEVRARGELIWGADIEGGGPYIYVDPDDASKIAGFEVDLASALAKELGVKPRFQQVNWENLPASLGAGGVDIILNGYELTSSRAARMAHTRPYYVYELALLGHRDNPLLRDWNDLDHQIEGHHPRVGVLGGSGASIYLKKRFGDRVDQRIYGSSTEAMLEVKTGKIDATVADLPAVVFFRDRFPELERLGPLEGRGDYVIYLRQDDTRLRDALDAALAKLWSAGEIKRIDERYGIWTPAQEALERDADKSDAERGLVAVNLHGWSVIRDRGWLLVQAAGVTVALACCSMPLAMALGLLVAIARMYGPAPVRWLAIGYVELLRGTPLMLQLFVIYYAPSEFDRHISAWNAAILGLAINYSAAEAENYRAGLQAVARGQMEAALALGMSPLMALRRVIVPQAARIVIPPVTNDFIALFKDTSVCSVITVVELTKQYSIQINDTGAMFEIGALTAALYLAMSVPLARVASAMERRLDGPRRRP